MLTEADLGLMRDLLGRTDFPAALVQRLERFQKLWHSKFQGSLPPQVIMQAIVDLDLDTNRPADGKTLKEVFAGTFEDEDHLAMAPAIQRGLAPQGNSEEEDEQVWNKDLPTRSQIAAMQQEEPIEPEKDLPYVSPQDWSKVPKGARCMVETPQGVRTGFYMSAGRNGKKRVQIPGHDRKFALIDPEHVTVQLETTADATVNAGADTS